MFQGTPDWERITEGLYRCTNCGRSYKYKCGLYTHQQFECGKEPQFPCPYCEYRAKRKGNLTSHLANKHRTVAV
ncbi:hypothetical protein J6590_014726 [Homalodisca vitripennis]|nr:hypothetical protein J6590_014726 [Homalodisca vitripennis]